MEYTLKDGTILNDKDIAQLGEACERGEYPGTPGSWVVRPAGIPRLSKTEESVTVSVKIPVSMRQEIERRAKENQETMSEFLRDTLERALMS